MKPRTAYFLVGLALAGAAVVWFWERKLPGTAEIQEQQGLLFPEWKADQVDQLTIRRPQEELIFQRQEDTWKLVKPVEDRADGPTVNDLIREVVSLRSSAALLPAEIQGGAEGAGFGKPGSLSFTLRAGSQNLGFEIGSEVIPGGSRFVKVNGRTEVLVVPSLLAELAGRPATDFRDHALFSLTTASIREFEVIRSDGEEMAFLRKPDGGWWITRPLEDDADDSLVSGILGSALGLQAETITDFPSADQAAFLAHPVLTLRMKTEPPAPQIIEVRLTQELGKDSPRRLARSNVRNPVFEVDAGSLSRSLEKKPADFSTLLLLDFSPFDLAEGEISRGGKTAKALPGNPKADELWGLLARVEALRSVPPSAAAGLDPPVARLVLRFKDSAAHPPVTLEIGGPAGPDETYARRSGRKKLFVIQTETARLIDPSRVN